MPRRLFTQATIVHVLQKRPLVALETRHIWLKQENMFRISIYSYKKGTFVVENIAQIYVTSVWFQEVKL